jgi:hypothetical protein
MGQLMRANFLLSVLLSSNVLWFYIGKTSYLTTFLQKYKSQYDSE